jgi:hypothetical protein
MEEKRKVVIDRKTWGRSRQGDSYAGRLFDGETYCCLGFVCKQLFGKTDEEILTFDEPSQVDVSSDALPDDVVLEAIRLNDRHGPDLPHMTDLEQEEKIAELFAGVGIEVEYGN